MYIISCLFSALSLLTAEASHLGLIERDHLARLVCQHSPDPALSLSIAKVESGFQRGQVSETWDYGLFQINRQHLKSPGEELLGDWPRQVVKHSRILRDAIEAGDWGYYHSRTPKYLSVYRKKVLHFYLKYQQSFADNYLVGGGSN